MVVGLRSIGLDVEEKAKHTRHKCRLVGWLGSFKFNGERRGKNTEN